MSLILGISPKKESIKALYVAGDALKKYFQNDEHKKGSALIQARYNHSVRFGVPLDDISRAEVGGVVALLSNTVPVSFWMLYHVYSDPIVLDDCRSELEKIVDRGVNDKGEKSNTIDMSKVKQHCPILLATLKETLRTYSTVVSAREVTEDYMLDGQYLLKKGATVMMPSTVQHSNAAVWGPDHATFKHKRFLTQNNRAMSSSFRSFGGGTTLCPGRHFASTEILAFVSVMILRFDMQPTKGTWVEPSTNKAEFWEAIRSPDSDFEVEIIPRESDDKVGEWVFTLSDSKKGMVLSAEDMTGGGEKEL